MRPHCVYSSFITFKLSLDKVGFVVCLFDLRQGLVVQSCLIWNTINQGGFELTKIPGLRCARPCLAFHLQVQNVSKIQIAINTLSNKSPQTP